MVKRYMYGDMSPPGVKFEVSVESTSLVLFRLCGNCLIQHGGKLSCPACATNACPACVFRLSLHVYVVDTTKKDSCPACEYSKNVLVISCPA